MKLTMSRIAKLAKVSQTTVSLIVNGKADGRISPETQKEVRKVLKDHHFQPHPVARSSRQGRGPVIGILSPPPRDNFTAGLMTRLQSSLRERGAVPVFYFRENMSPWEDFRKMLSRQHSCGLIAWEYADMAAGLKIPCVLFDRKHEGTDSVMIDHGAAFCQAAEYLRQLGHSRIGYIGPLESPLCAHFRAELGRLDLPVREEWIQSAEAGTPENGSQAMGRLLGLPAGERPTAVMVCSDGSVCGIYAAARETGLRIPEDLSIVSFGNDRNSGYLDPPLTTLDLPVEAIAETLAERMFAKLGNPGNPDCAVSIMPRMVIRKSCARPRK